MQRYRSHKVVEAEAMTEDADPIGWGVELDSGEKIEWPEGFFARGVPKAGDYLVRYEPDGYLSWSPKDKFEADYVAID